MMRTTITLEADVAALVEKRMSETSGSFKSVVNDALRKALAPVEASPFRPRTFDMGYPSVDLTKALDIASEIEDAEILRKQELGK